MNTPDPKCTKCGERAGVVYINKRLTCAHCARKYENARRFVRNPPSQESQPRARDWSKSFTAIDDRRQWAIDDAAHIYTTPPMVKPLGKTTAPTPPAENPTIEAILAKRFTVRKTTRKDQQC